MTENPLYRKAMVRSALAAVAIIVWIVAFDGPTWGWALLAGYLALTWLVAFGLTQWVAKRAAEHESDT